MLCRPCRQINGRVTYGECAAHCHVLILPVTNVSLHILPKNHNTQETFQSTDYQGLKQIITLQQQLVSIPKCLSKDGWVATVWFRPMLDLADRKKRAILL